MVEAGTVVDLTYPPTSSDPEVLFSILAEQVSLYLPDAADLELLSRAYRRAVEYHRGVMRDSGEPYVTHPLHVALILAYLQLDIETLAAALLHDVLEDTPATYDGLRDEFGHDIAELVEGVSKLSKVSQMSRTDQSAANVQKIFLAMSEDLRVIFIKLADRLHNLRTLEFRRNPDSRERSAAEALSIYARIADRLGIAVLRKEMEDLAFSYLNPALYQRVKSSIEGRYEHAGRIEWIVDEVLGLLGERGIPVVENGVRTNPRRVYDMFRRLQDAADPTLSKPKRVPPQIRFHLIVEDVSSCYMAMAAIHSHWTPIASETRDYISAPLTNGYQSLHTTVFIDELPVKFQIRTQWMHTTSQLGIIAHMQHGELSRASPELKRTVEDLREFGVEVADESQDPIEFLTSLKAEVLGDDIYVYTPRNKVIQLPVGSTPIDFAYRIHTDVGHQCRGALVDDRWVSLKRSLRTGERVEILTMEGEGPSFDWLNPVLGYTQSPLAKSKIRRWFRRRPDEERVALGKAQLYRVIDRLALEVDDWMPLARRFTYPDETSLFRDVGGCDLPLERVVPLLIEVYGAEQLPSYPENHEMSIPIVGAGSLQKSMALCCRPQPGDDIVGFMIPPHDIVEVHRSDCPQFLQKLTTDRSRMIEVRWGRVGETFLACMEITSHDRPFFLRDVWNVISDRGLNVANVDILVQRAQMGRISVCVDVESWLQLNAVMAQIEDLPGAMRVRRIPVPVEVEQPHGVPA